MNVNERNRVIEKLYITSYKKFVKQVNSRCHNMADAEDIVQEAFCRALTYFDSLDNRGVHAWFSVILENAFNHHMNDQRRSGCVDHDELDEGHLVGEMSEWADDMMKRIEAEINEVKDVNHRMVLFLYFVRGYKPREILDVVPLKAGNVRIIIHRFGEEIKEKYGKGDKRI